MGRFDYQITDKLRFNISDTYNHNVNDKGFRGTTLPGSFARPVLRPDLEPIHRDRWAHMDAAPISERFPFGIQGNQETFSTGLTSRPTSQESCSSRSAWPAAPSSRTASPTATPTSPATTPCTTSWTTCIGRRATIRSASAAISSAPLCTRRRSDRPAFQRSAMAWSPPIRPRRSSTPPRCPPSARHHSPMRRIYTRCSPDASPRSPAWSISIPRPTSSFHSTRSSFGRR